MSGTPCSMAVGMSGAPLSRCWALTARMRILPVLWKLEHLAADVRRHDRDVPADQVGDAGPGALVGNVHHVVQSGHRLEQFAGQMAHRAGAGRAVGQLAGIGLHVGDQLLDVLRRHRRMHRDRGRADAEDRDRHEVLVADRRPHCSWSWCSAPWCWCCRAATVWPSGSARLHLHDAERAARAAEVLDIDRAEHRLHPLGPLPADDVVDAAGRERHHELDRPARERGLRDSAVAARQARPRMPRGRVSERRVVSFVECSCNLLNLEAGGLDDRRPARELAQRPSRCAASGPESSTGSKPDLIICSCTCGSAIAARGLVGDLVDDVLRHAGRREQAVEVRGHHAPACRLRPRSGCRARPAAASSPTPRGCAPCRRAWNCSSGPPTFGVIIGMCRPRGRRCRAPQPL